MAAAKNVVRDMLRVQLYIVLLCGLLTVMTCTLESFYPQIVSVRFASPSDNPFTVGWFSGYNWWKTALFVLAIPPSFLAMLTLVFNNVKPLKVLLLAYLVLALLWWLGVIITDIVFVTGANNPAQPDNPASSFNRCCTPQYYTTVPYCNGPALPLYCGPVPWSLADLGLNGPFIYALIWECLYLVLTGGLAVLTLRLMSLVDKFNATGDENFVKRTLAETGTPYYQPVPIIQQQQQQPATVPLLVPRR